MLRPVCCILLFLRYPVRRSGRRSLSASGSLVRAVILAGYCSIALRCQADALPVALLDEVVDQLAGAVVHLDVERFHLAGEVVEGHNGRDGDEQAERRGDQGFRDTAGDCADTGGLLGRDLLEGVQNTDHRSEQADKRSRRTDGGQTAQTALQLGVNDGFRALESALGALDLLFGDGAARTEAAELLQASGDNFGQVRLLVAVGNLDRLVQTAILQRAGNLGGELARLLAGRARSRGRGR